MTASGFTIGGVKYQGVKGDERSIYGKQGAAGVIIAKAGQCLVVGRYSERQVPSTAANTVEKLAEYLIEQGQ